MIRSIYPLSRTIGVCAFMLLATGSLGQAPPKTPSQLKNDLGVEFVRIASGEFMMGCAAGDNACSEDESPRHRVQITKSFEIGKYEVTQAQWVALMRENPSSIKGDNQPVETVSKTDVQQFISKLNELNDGYRYRLPTEGEWEFAARAGENSPVKLDDVAWYAANSDDETHPVGTKKPNAWGIFDMLGNVREWVSDLYSAAYYGQSPTADPAGPTPQEYAKTGFGGGAAGFPLLGGPGGRGATPAPTPTPVELPEGGTPQQQIDALRKEVAQLRDEILQLRAQFPGPGGFAFGGAGRAGQPPPGLGFGFGGPGSGTGKVAGPAVLNSAGELIDPLDGLLTGFPKEWARTHRSQINDWQHCKVWLEATGMQPAPAMETRILEAEDGLPMLAFAFVKSGALLQPAEFRLPFFSRNLKRLTVRMVLGPSSVTSSFRLPDMAFLGKPEL